MFFVMKAWFCCCARDSACGRARKTINIIWKTIIPDKLISLRMLLFVNHLTTTVIILIHSVWFAIRHQLLSPLWIKMEHQLIILFDTVYWIDPKRPSAVSFLHPNVSFLHLNVSFLHLNVRLLHLNVPFLHPNVRHLHPNVWLLYPNVWLLHLNVWLLHTNVWLLHTNVRLLHSNVWLLHTNVRFLYPNVSCPKLAWQIYS